MMMIDDEESTTTAVGILEAGNGQVLSLAKLCSFHVRKLLFSTHLRKEHYSLLFPFAEGRSLGRASNVKPLIEY